jgi:hypothetical protein
MEVHLKVYLVELTGVELVSFSLNSLVASIIGHSLNPSLKTSLVFAAPAGSSLFYLELFFRI